MKQLTILLNHSAPITHAAYIETKQAIEANNGMIVTPCIEYFSTAYIDRYIVCARLGDNQICLNDLVQSGRVRIAQNAAKMLLSGAFEDLGISI